MTMVLTDGLDHYTAAQATLKGWSRAFTSMPAGRFAGQCGRCTGNATQFTKSLPSTYSTLILGFAFRTSQISTGWSTNNAMIWQTNAAGTIMTLNADGSGRLVIKNSGGTTIATGTTVIVANTWHYIEIKLVINGASGSVEVHLDGVTEIASTTGNFGSTNVAQIACLGLNGNTDFDDMVFLDTTGSAPNNTFIGDVRIVTPMPVGAGAHTQFQPNGAANNWDCVDDTTPDDDTTYVSDANPGDIDTYDCANIDGGAQVFAVQTNIYARKDDANVRQVAPVIRQAGSDSVGTTVTLGASYQFYTQIYNQDPTATDWTAINVNADEFGVKEIA